MSKIPATKKLLLITVFIWLTGCATTQIPEQASQANIIVYNVENVFYEVPRDLAEEEARLAAIQRYSPVLKGKKFFLDPGHGGEDRRNKSLSGKVVEADVNLYVALYLKRFLEESGAVVYMSRDKDTTVDLKYRSVLANNSGADFFISIHHNAPGNSEHYWINYTSTFYHGTDDDYEYEPANHDLARYVQRDLAYAMGNSGGLGSFDGTYSDYMIYAKAGFSVLRETQIPAILIECAFYTNRIEESRLQIDEFNKIQGWGIYKGIGKYFLAGYPEIEMIKDRSRSIGNNVELVFSLSSKSPIKPESVKAYADSVVIPHVFDPEKSELTLLLENPSRGEKTIRVLCTAKNGNSAQPYHKKILIK